MVLYCYLTGRKEKHRECQRNREKERNLIIDHSMFTYARSDICNSPFIYIFSEILIFDIFLTILSL